MNQDSDLISPDKEMRQTDRRDLPGRRSVDHLPKTTFTRKGLVIIVAVVDAVYLVSEAFLTAQTSCL